MRIEHTHTRPPNADGFALILALLSLLLLTFLGLTLATTTSTELQIATNYRWSQQAAYNAEAGIEAAKIYLRDHPSSWATLLPSYRGSAATWTGAAPMPTAPTAPGGMPATDAYGNPLRNWWSQSCDYRGGNVGYGVILNPVAGALQYTNSVPWLAQGLNGAFTVWVRRGVLINTAAATFADDPSDLVLILTSEGIAPYASAGTQTLRANIAVAVRELTLLRGIDSCEAYKSQQGGNVSGTGFWACAVLEGPEALRGALGDARRQAGGAASSAFGSGAAGTLGTTGAN